MNVRQDGNRTGKVKRLLALILCAGLVLGLFPSLRVQKVKATSPGDQDTFRAEGTEYRWYFNFPNGSAWTSTTKKIIRNSDNEVVFCVEPVHSLSTNGTYTAYEAANVILDGQTPQGWSTGQNRVITPEQRDLAALWVYHGWDLSPTKTEDEYMAVQLFVWELLWGVNTQSFTNLSAIRAHQAAIREKVNNHGQKPLFTGISFNAASRTVTLKTGDTISLTDENQVLQSADVMENTTGLETKIEGNQLHLTATADSHSGYLRFYKYPDVAEDATSIIYAYDGGQKVGAFKTNDPSDFLLNVNVIQEGEIAFTKMGPNDQPLAGGRFQLLNKDGQAVRLRALEEGKYTVDLESSITTFTTKAGKASIINLPAGAYTIREIEAPENFKRADDLPIAVEAGESTQAILRNEEQTGEILIRKQAADGTPLAATTFRITGSDGFVKEGRTGADGIYRLENLRLGTYTIQEITPSAGYQFTGDASAEIQLIWVPGQSTAYAETIITNQRQTFSLNLKKTDAQTGNPLAGAIFELRDPEGKVLESLTSRQDGTVSSAKHEILYSGGIYSVVEVKAPAGYHLAKDAVQTFVVEGDQSNQNLSFEKAFTNEAITASVDIQKYDVLNGVQPSGSASFAGAKYQIIAVEFFDPANAPYKPGDVVGTLVTDASGQAKSVPLPLGTYDLVEVSPSTGYQINETAVRFQITSDGETKTVKQLSFNAAPLVAEINERIQELNTLWQTEGSTHEALSPITEAWLTQDTAVLTAERVRFGRVELNKVLAGVHDVPGEPKQAEEGIVFSLLDASGREVDVLETNKNGWASSKWLPYGSYTLRQVTEQDHAYKVNDQVIQIDQDWTLYAYQLQNEAVKARLKIVKLDADSGKPIPQVGVTFVIYKDGERLTQTLYYPKKEEISEFQTASDGTVELPEMLAVGNYVLKETKGPQGYVLPAEGREISFRIDRTLVANLQDLTLTIEVQNKAAKGQILIDKQGPILSAWQAEAYPYLAYVDASDTEEGTKGQWVERSIDVYRPVFSRSYLEGAVFEVRAAEDLYLGDGTLAYRQGDFVETITTKREGPSTSQEIPLGKYTVQEVTAPAGYAQNSTVQTITLSQENPAQALVQESVAIANEKQQGEISFTKTFENSPWFPLYEDAAGAVVFGLFTEKEIVQDGVSLPAGTCVGVTKLDEQRKGQFSGLLADQSYVLRELATAQEYQLNRSDYQIALRAVDKTTPVSKVELAEPIANKLKTHEIVLTKLDQKSGKALAGAVFTLLAVTPDGDIAIGEYSTDQNGVLTIKNLHAGTYYLQEVRAPEGYYLDKKKIPLVLDGSTSIHTEAVTNESTVVTFYKRDKEKLSLVPGATLQVLDQEGTVIHEWVSDGTAHQLEGILVAGKEYILREVKAPKGYLPSADVRFFVPLTQEAQEAEILNEQTVTEISKQRAGGEELPGAKLELFDDQGVLLESWTSSDKPHIVRGLEPGKTYTLHEDAAPAGYQLAQDIQFTINEDGSVTKVKMVNLEVPEVPTTGEAEQYGLHIALLGLCFLGMKKLFVKKRED